MSSWTPDDSPFDPFADREETTWKGADAAPPVSMAINHHPVHLRLARYTGEDVPEGLAGLLLLPAGLTDDEARPIARWAVEPPVADALVTADVVAAPVTLMLAAREEADRGLYGLLYLGLDAATQARLQEQAPFRPEGWRGSTGEDLPPLAWLNVGVIKRLPANRRHTTLDEETADLLTALVTRGGMPVAAKVVENLLDSL
jgi:hypothetical protein